MERSRDDQARSQRNSVPCLKCGKLYYPGLPDDRHRPRDNNGKLIRVSSCDYQGYCSKTCQPSKY
jgi:hypothetical protein